MPWGHPLDRATGSQCVGSSAAISGVGPILLLASGVMSASSVSWAPEVCPIFIYF